MYLSDLLLYTNKGDQLWHTTLWSTLHCGKSEFGLLAGDSRAEASSLWAASPGDRELGTTCQKSVGGHDGKVAPPRKHDAAGLTCSASRAGRCGNAHGIEACNSQIEPPSPNPTSSPQQNLTWTSPNCALMSLNWSSLWPFCFGLPW
jgi:hypothetical protein